MDITDKKLKIMVGVNTLTSVDQLAYSNHIQAFFRWGRSLPNIDFAINNPRRCGIDRMRNETAKIALENEYDYVLFLDDDVLIPHIGLKWLLEADKDIAAGWTIIRGWPFDNMFFKKDETGGLKLYKDPVEINSDGYIECDAVGFSFCLIKCDLLKKINPPYFVTGTHHTEDVYFCMKARQMEPDCSIIVHPDVKTGHILGSEIIEPGNREAYKVYASTVYPEMCDLVGEKKHDDRGDAYLEKISKEFDNRS